jgi:hypothetical protein
MGKVSSFLAGISEDIPPGAANGSLKRVFFGGAVCGIELAEPF